MSKILVTGGCGYIGSHTIADLIQHGYEVISIDDNSKSSMQLLAGVERITGRKIKNYKVDLKKFEDTCAVFEENTDIESVIHFAAYKAVGESTEKPLEYYENNLFGVINILKCMHKFNVPHFVFSSSCTVYGSPDEIPVTEQTPVKKAESPYGATKQMAEQIIEDYAKVNNTNTILLRYFNPVGAHPSIEIGELPLGKPMNLVPAITQTAIGKLPQMIVHGNDYETRDGSALRDFIHVADIAHAHTLALQFLQQKRNAGRYEIFNLGTGNGYTVLEVIKAFEQVSGEKLNYTIGPRRPGDIVAIYANNRHAVEQLHWHIKYDLHAMMDTAWKWELKIKANPQLAII